MRSDAKARREKIIDAACDLLRTRPELAFDGAVEEAKRIVAMG